MSQLYGSKLNDLIFSQWFWLHSRSMLFFKAEYNLSVIWSNKSIVDLMRQFVSYIFPFRVNLNYHPCMNFAYTITLCFVNWNTYHLTTLLSLINKTLYSVWFSTNISKFCFVIFWYCFVEYFNFWIYFNYCTITCMSTGMVYTNPCIY